jgi:hypothetical protein
MAAQDVLRLTGVVIKEAIGGCEHGVVPTGFRQRGGGVLGQDVSKFHQVRGAPDITEFGLGKFGDGPVGGIGEVAQAQLLCQRVALGAAVGL